MKLGNYIIDFYHHQNIPGYNGMTICTININDKIVQDKSYCCHNDQFNKKVGRKIALTRTLNRANISKEERRDIWNDYLKQVKV